MTIGSSDLRVAPLGVGAWSWGERLVWGYGRGYGRADVAALEAATRAWLR